MPGGNNVPKRDATPRQALLACVQILRLGRAIGSTSSPLVLCVTFRLLSLLPNLLSYATVSLCHLCKRASTDALNLRCAIRFWIFLLSLGSLTELQSSSCGDADDCVEVCAVLDSACDVCDMTDTLPRSSFTLPSWHIRLSCGWSFGYTYVLASNVAKESMRNI